MPSILLVIQRLWKGGGTETHVLTLALALKRKGHKVAVLTSGGPWVARFRSSGIPVYLTTAFRHPTRMNTSTLRRLIRIGGYGVIHAHDTASFNFVRIALQPALWRSVRVIMTVHGPYVKRRSIRRLASKAHAVIAVSPGIRRHVLNSGVNPKCIYLIPNGVDTTVFRANPSQSLRQSLKIPKSAHVVGYAGRFSFDKTRLSRQISQRLCRYSASRKGVYAIIAGRNAKTHINGGKYCKVVGHVENMPSFYNSCDVVVGTARVALEALSTGKPTIAVGHAKYVGILRRENLRQAYQSNFGDHGPVQGQSDSRRLVKDLNQLRRDYTQFRKEARYVSRVVRTRFSIERQIRKLEALYGVDEWAK